MHRVLVTDKLSEAGLSQLEQTDGIELINCPGLYKESPEKVKEAMQDADGIIIRSETKLTPDLLEGQKRLKVIVRAGVGVDNIDIPTATREGILVMNTPAGNTVSTAELTVAMMMALSRNIGPASASMREGKWDRKKFSGTQLSGKTLAVVGLGRIGMAVARRAQGLEMKVIGVDPFLSPEVAAESGVELYQDVSEVLPLCDYITVHTPGGDATKSMIGAEELAQMKKGARLINCARGGIINETALAEAIESGHIAGAALDVFVDEPPKDDTLTSLPQVLCTPHLGASTGEAQEGVAVEAAEIICDYLINKEVRHAINMAPISGAEMDEMKRFLDLGYRLGLLLAQQNHGGSLKEATIHYRGEVASKKTKAITASFAAGLMESSFHETVNMINAVSMAEQRGIEITESSSSQEGDFSTMISATIVTDEGELNASGTVFGYEYLRLIRLGEFRLEAFLEGNLLIYRHIDKPGQIGRIGQILGSHNVNIADMSLGRATRQAGGDSVAVLHLDDVPSETAMKEICDHPEVTGVDLVILPKAGQPLPWLGSS